MDNNSRQLIDSLDKIHTTKLGEERIHRNAGLENSDALDWCKSLIVDKDSAISRRGKNWYIEAGPFLITVNASSYTIITAHRVIAKQSKVRTIN